MSQKRRQQLTKCLCSCHQEQLVQQAEAVGVDTQGRKTEIIDRLLDHLVTQVNMRMANPVVV